jgi:hypothetical protein
MAGIGKEIAIMAIKSTILSAILGIAMPRQYINTMEHILARIIMGMGIHIINNVVLQGVIIL